MGWIEVWLKQLQICPAMQESLTDGTYCCLSLLHSKTSFLWSWFLYICKDFMDTCVEISHFKTHMKKEANIFKEEEREREGLS